MQCRQLQPAEPRGDAGPLRRPPSPPPKSLRTPPAQPVGVTPPLPTGAVAATAECRRPNEWASRSSSATGGAASVQQGGLGRPFVSLLFRRLAVSAATPLSLPIARPCALHQPPVFPAAVLHTTPTNTPQSAPTTTQRPTFTSHPQHRVATLPFSVHTTHLLPLPLPLCQTLLVVASPSHRLTADAASGDGLGFERGGSGSGAQFEHGGHEEIDIASVQAFLSSPAPTACDVQHRKRANPTSNSRPATRQRQAAPPPSAPSSSSLHPYQDSASLPLSKTFEESCGMDEGLGGETLSRASTPPPPAYDDFVSRCVSNYLEDKLHQGVEVGAQTSERAPSPPQPPHFAPHMLPRPFRQSTTSSSAPIRLLSPCRTPLLVRRRL